MTESVLVSYLRLIFKCSIYLLVAVKHELLRVTDFLLAQNQESAIFCSSLSMYLKICCEICIVGGHFINHQFYIYVDNIDYKNGLPMGYLSVVVENSQRF